MEGGGAMREQKEPRCRIRRSVIKFQLHPLGYRLSLLCPLS